MGEPLAYRFVYALKLKGIYRPLTELVGRLRPARVLEVGGGYGYAVEEVIGIAGCAVSLDIEEGMVVKAQRRFRFGGQAVLGDAGRLPFREGAFDLVYFFDSLHHIPNREEALSEAIRVLREGGHLAIFDFDRSKPLTKFIAVMERIFGLKSEFYTLEELVDRIRRLGMELIETESRAAGMRLLAVKPRG